MLEDIRLDGELRANATPSHPGVILTFTTKKQGVLTFCCDLFHGWKNNLRLTNGEVELIVTLDVGPRVIRYGYVDGPNVFKEYEDQLGKSGEVEWQIRGGHRLWVAPEDLTRTYAPDNQPVQSPTTGIQLIPP